MNFTNWIFGLTAGLIPAVMMFFLFRDAWYEQPDLQVRFTLGSYGLLAICIVFAAIAWRKLTGSISLGRTMVTGLAVAALRGIILVFAFTTLYFSHPEWLVKPERQATEQYLMHMKAEEKTPENEQKVRASVKRQFTPIGFAQSALFESLIIGVIVSALTAGFIARPSNQHIES